MTRKDTLRAKGTASPRCRLCRRYPRYSDETAAAVRESERIMSGISAGRRRPLTFESFLAERVAV